MDHDAEIQNYIGAIIKFSNRMYLESPVTDKEDLVQAGFVGMLNGLESYSEDKAKATGTKKTTYVIQCIRNSILQEANKFFGATSLPHNKRLKFNAFKRLFNENKNKDIIKTELEITDDEYNEFVGLLNLKTVIHIDALTEDNNNSIIYIDGQSEDEIDEEYLRGLGLNEDDIRILQLKVSGLTYNDIAEYYNVSRETMRKRIHKTIQRIKSSLIE